MNRIAPPDRQPEQQARRRPDGDDFPTRDVVDILGISRRQLQYWAQTDLVRPSAATPGGHRRYGFTDLVALKATKRLIDAGVSVQRIRGSIQALRRKLPEIDRPLREMVLVATGDVVLVFHASSSFETVAGHEWVFEVASFERELQAWRRALDRLPPDRERGKARASRAREQREPKRESTQRD